MRGNGTYVNRSRSHHSHGDCAIYLCGIAYGEAMEERERGERKQNEEGDEGTREDYTALEV